MRAQVAQQIRSAQQKAALAGQAPPAWAIGAKCQAVYSLDGEWYEASVVGVTTAGDFVVKFAAYGNTEQARPGRDLPFGSPRSGRRWAFVAGEAVHLAQRWVPDGSKHGVVVQSTAELPR